MTSYATNQQAIGKGRRWTGRTLSGLMILFLLMDAVMKILKAAPSVAGTVQVGYPEGTVAGIGVLLLVCTLLYTIPRTAVVGAILLTGYLGGAVATQVRVGNPLFAYVLAPVYFAAMIWGGLYLRDPRVRQILS